MSSAQMPLDPLATLLDQIRQRHAALVPMQGGTQQIPPLPSLEAERAARVPLAVCRLSPAGEMLPARHPDVAPRNQLTTEERRATSSPLRIQLEDFGLLPAYAAQVEAAVRRRLPARGEFALAEELAAVNAVLSSHWRETPRTGRASPWHVFVGAPGAGKTTALCKWLAQTVLLAEWPARVWRLDGLTANTAEALSVLAEVLGVPLSRAWPESGHNSGDTVNFVDLPGVDWRDADAVETLRQRLSCLPAPQIHLVLNAAYEASGLLAQTAAFARWPVADLICTHLDEEARWGKLWNLVLGTKFALGFLSAGQNVPGDFQAASLERLLPDR